MALGGKPCFWVKFKLSSTGQWPMAWPAEGGSILEGSVIAHEKHLGGFLMMEIPIYSLHCDIVSLR